MKKIGQFLNSNCHNYKIDNTLLEKVTFLLTDINECDEGLVKVGETKTSLWCHQKCVNTLGSYQCACNTGYQLGTDSRTCLG